MNRWNAPPLRFSRSVWQWSDELERCEEAQLHARLVAREDDAYAKVKFELWRAAGYAVHQRHRRRKAARALLSVVRDAWLQRDNALRLERCLHAARILIIHDLYRPVVDVALGVAEQRRKAARAPRSDVSNEEIAAHRALYSARYGNTHGWQKRAAIDLGMTERNLRRRLEKIRT